MQTVKKYARAGLLGVAFMSVAFGAARAEDSADPIKIIMNNWSSQVVFANVIGQLLEQQGKTVEYVPSDTQLQYTALANGDMDFQIEVWEGSQAEAFDKAVAAGAL